MKKILTVTLNPCIDKTITIDDFTYGGLNRAVNHISIVGGKGINCATILSGMGQQVISLGMTAGTQVQQYHKDMSIPYGGVVCKGDVRTNYKIVNSSDKITTEINEPGFIVSGDEVEKLIALFSASLDDVGVAILSGSAPIGVKDDIYYRLTDIASKHNVPVILDTDGPRLKEGIKAKPYFIKPNTFEICQLLNDNDAAIEKQIAELKKHILTGVKLAAISMGECGAIFVDNKQTIRVYAPETKCISTTGAGDSMVAMIAYGIVNNLDLINIGRLAVCAGSLTCERVGLCDGKEALDNYTSIKAEIIGG
ncbi:MAG: hexose kinase [Eubacteriales bacterium]|nr:hexose kinase [Eubacteriales bacterium]